MDSMGRPKNPLAEFRRTDCQSVHDFWTDWQSVLQENGDE
jgi:hypothetical protein